MFWLYECLFTLACISCTCVYIYFNVFGLEAASAKMDTIRNHRMITRLENWALFKEPVIKRIFSLSTSSFLSWNISYALSSIKEKHCTTNYKSSSESVEYRVAAKLKALTSLDAVKLHACSSQITSFQVTLKRFLMFLPLLHLSSEVIECLMLWITSSQPLFKFETNVECEECGEYRGSRLIKSPSGWRCPVRRTCGSKLERNETGQIMCQNFGHVNFPEGPRAYYCNRWCKKSIPCRGRIVQTRRIRLQLNALRIPPLQSKRLAISAFAVASLLEIQMCPLGSLPYGCILIGITVGAFENINMFLTKREQKRYFGRLRLHDSRSRRRS